MLSELFMCASTQLLHMHILNRKEIIEFALFCKVQYTSILLFVKGFKALWPVLNQFLRCIPLHSILIRQILGIG